MKVVWTAKALARLVELHDYIAEQSSFNAIAVVERLTARAALLAMPPLTGRRVPEYRQDDIREVLDRPYRLIYRVTRERIEVLTVKHYRQRLSERPGDL
jgi:plasmid stabilization system protein ParE